MHGGRFDNQRSTLGVITIESHCFLFWMKAVSRSNQEVEFSRSLGNAPFLMISALHQFEQPAKSKRQTTTEIQRKCWVFKICHLHMSESFVQNLCLNPQPPRGSLRGYKSSPLFPPIASTNPITPTPPSFCTSFSLFFFLPIR